LSKSSARVVPFCIDQGPEPAEIPEQFVLHYQPRVDLQSRVTTSAEALVRWEHPTAGLLYPDSFIRHFEEDGRIYGLGDWIITEAVRQAAVWAASGGPRVSVNVSAKQVQVSNFIARIEQALSRFSLNPNCLELEVTESCGITDTSSASKILGELRELGLSIALDDFGTGAMTMNVLIWMPVNVIKLDQAVARTLLTSSRTRDLARATIKFAEALQATVVLEGVETPEQLGIARDLGFHEVQGFLFSRATPPGMLTNDWASHSAWAKGDDNEIV